MSIENPSPIVTPEQQEAPAHIKLSFFRHSIKGGAHPLGDQYVELTPEGRQLAQEKYSSESNPDQSLAFGSECVRAQETALIKMTGQTAESFEELVADTNAEHTYGSRVGVDPRLDFMDNAATLVGQSNIEAAGRKEYVREIILQSDQRALETGDASGANFSHKAAQVARIVQKYADLRERWQQLVNDENKTYEPTLERQLGTHQGIGESFLAKLAQKTENTELYHRLLEEKPNGFDFVEGFEVDISNDPAQELPITVIYTLNGQEYRIPVSEAIIQEMIADSDQIEQTIAAAKQQAQE